MLIYDVTHHLSRRNIELIAIATAILRQLNDETDVTIGSIEGELHQSEK